METTVIVNSTSNTESIDKASDASDSKSENVTANISETSKNIDSESESKSDNNVNSNNNNNNENDQGDNNETNAVESDTAKNISAAVNHNKSVDSNCDSDHANDTNEENNKSFDNSSTFQPIKIETNDQDDHSQGDEDDRDDNLKNNSDGELDMDKEFTEAELAGGESLVDDEDLSDEEYVEALDEHEREEDEEEPDEGDEGEEEEEEEDDDDDEEVGSLEGEREEGDGQESTEQTRQTDKELDDDEDRRNPQYIPKRGAFYEHDDRLGDEEEVTAATGEKEVEKPATTVEKKVEPTVEPRKTKKLWSDDGKWGHDMFNDDEQKPKAKDEIISTYGYDIRNEDGPPKARRRRRYGRGPNHYTRSWKDEGAYSKAGEGPHKSRVKRDDSSKRDKERPSRSANLSDRRDRNSETRSTSGNQRRREIKSTVNDEPERDRTSDRAPDRIQDRVQDRGQDRVQDRERHKDRDPDCERERDRVPDRERDRNFLNRDKFRDVSGRDKIREVPDRDRTRDHERNRDKDGGRDKERPREKDRERDRENKRRLDFNRPPPRRDHREFRDDFRSDVRSDLKTEHRNESKGERRPPQNFNENDFPELPLKTREKGRNLSSSSNDHSQPNAWNKSRLRRPDDRELAWDPRHVEEDYKTEPMRVIDAIENNKRQYNPPENPSRVEVVKTQTFENSRYSSRRPLVKGHSEANNVKKDIGLNRNKGRPRPSEREIRHSEVGRPITKTSHLTESNYEDDRSEEIDRRGRYSLGRERDSIDYRHSRDDARDHPRPRISDDVRNRGYRDDRNYESHLNESELTSGLNKLSLDKNSRLSDIDSSNQLKPKRYSSLRQHSQQQKQPQQPQQTSQQQLQPQSQQSHSQPQSQPQQQPRVPTETPLNANISQYPSSSQHLNLNHQRQSSSGQYYEAPSATNQASSNYYIDNRSPQSSFGYIPTTSIEGASNASRFLSQIAPRFISPTAQPPPTAEPRFMAQAVAAAAAAGASATPGTGTIPSVIPGPPGATYLPTYPPGYPQYPPPPPPPAQFPLAPPPSAPELYRGGVTYYDTMTQQVSPRQLPQRRPKNALPIVPPPDLGNYEVDQDIETIT